MNDCDLCTFEWAIRFSDGTIVSVASGQLKELDKNMDYDDPYVQSWMLGNWLEYLGGRLGQLPECVVEKFDDEDAPPDLSSAEVLVEGRWMPLKIRGDLLIRHRSPSSKKG